MIELTDKEEIARSRVCLPLDNLRTLDAVEERVRELGSVVGMFKVGKGSYTRFGPDVVRAVRHSGGEVFLDLKYHDIPNTVRDASDAATNLGVHMFNVHASGGYKMLRAAVEGAEEAADRYGIIKPKVIGVTVLTSIDQNTLSNQLGINNRVEDQVLRLAELSRDAGLDGIVCSAADLQFITAGLPDGFMYITPGIKGPNTPAGDDQKRVYTPGNAIEDGSSILVVGRAITGPDTPEGRIQAGYDVLKDMAKHL
tara:strand:- start:265 stop:1026 length:762 start_codon:yes stop_codon:yes gene_type:complete